MMKIKKYDNPETRIRSLGDYLNSIFDDDLLERPFALYPLFRGKKWEPKVEVEENEKEYIVKAELAGVKEKNLDVSLNDHTFTIKAERKEETKEKKKDKEEYTEKVYGSFTRSFTLPSDVDEEKITAKYKNGLLEVIIPKDEKKTQVKKIKVEA
ncbi:MAG: Hsp20/alpha crystallin family protein [Spirochaetes bacterium]|nr:Hsp20/alpha crystallin family protein [Spirochaetota bacterium]